MMLDAIISAASLNVHETFVCEQLPTDNGLRPLRRVGQGELKTVLEDRNHSLAYIRTVGQERLTSWSSLKGCDDGYKRTQTVRIVVFAKRSDGICENMRGYLYTAFQNVQNNLTIALAAPGADILNITGAAIESNTYPTIQSEAPGMKLPLEWAMAYLELTIEVAGEPACFVNC